MAAMAEVGVCGPVPDDDLTRMAMPGEFSADEVRAALMLTRRAADAQFWLAHDLVTRLPQVHAAMLGGCWTSRGHGCCRNGRFSCHQSRPGRCVSNCWPARRS